MIAHAFFADSAERIMFGGDVLAVHILSFPVIQDEADFADRVAGGHGTRPPAPEHLARLRQRGLGAKRTNALREFALGVAAVTRFVAGAPLPKTHECVFAILALESEPKDPRL